VHISVHTRNSLIMSTEKVSPPEQVPKKMNCARDWIRSHHQQTIDKDHDDCTKGGGNIAVKGKKRAVE